MKTFVLGFIVGIALCIGIPLIVLATGGVNMAAMTTPGGVERWVAGLAVDHSRGDRAPTTPNPYANRPEVIASGLDHYDDNCVMCHGAPQLEDSEIAQGLNPRAPELSRSTRDMTDGEIFWTIKYGVRMSGMPAFAPTHSDDEIWKLVAFVRHLPHLTESERARLRQATSEEEHHQGADEAGERGETR